MSINSAAVARPELIEEIAQRYGSQFVVVAIDAKQRPDGEWYITTHGGTRFTDRELFAWAHEAQERGAGEILLTSMNHDGTRSGYPLPLFARLTADLRIPIIASGGAGCADHIVEVLTAGGADAALAASIFHYGETTVAEVKRQLAACGVSVRV